MDLISWAASDAAGDGLSRDFASAVKVVPAEVPSVAGSGSDSDGARRAERGRFPRSPSRRGRRRRRAGTRREFLRGVGVATARVAVAGHLASRGPTSSADGADAPRVVAPVEWQVIQRRDSSGGAIPVVVEHAGSSSAPLEARLVAGSAGPWTALERTGDRSRGLIPARAGGWYRLEVRRAGAESPVAVVERVGMGELFVVAGQSNSANHGEARQAPASDRVVTLAPDGSWRVASDPQPGASGDGGSFQPPLGDLLEARFGVPVGFVCCGIGATSVREWLPAGDRFPTPPTLNRRVRERADGAWESDGAAFAMLVARMEQCGEEGFRAVLWHQGESDANQADASRTLPGESYREFLTRVIRASRAAIGREAPWFVARATYHVPGDESSAEIRAAQTAVCDAGTAFEGPDSDALGAPFREGGGTGVHFSGPGLVRHAEAWFGKVAPWLEERLRGG